VAATKAQTPAGPESLAARPDAGRTVSEGQAVSAATPAHGPSQLSPQEQSDALKVRPLASSQLAQDLQRLDLSPTSFTAATPALDQTPGSTLQGLATVDYARERVGLPPLDPSGNPAGDTNVSIDDFPGHSNHSCANFVASILRHVDAYDFSNLPGGPSYSGTLDDFYVWSHADHVRASYGLADSPANPDFSSGQPGDVIQFQHTTGISLNGGAPNTGVNDYHPHTALIERNLSNGKYLVLEQNLGNDGQVHEDVIDLSGVNGGQLAIYQPEFSPTQLPPAATDAPPTLTV
jgi:hypothetical protein